IRPQSLFMTHAVTVCERAFQHVSEDLHIAMAVSSKSRARSDSIFIDHAQIPEAQELGIVIIGKRKRVECVKPAMIRVASVLASADFYHSRCILSGVSSKSLAADRSALVCAARELVH